MMQPQQQERIEPTTPAVTVHAPTDPVAEVAVDAAAMASVPVADAIVGPTHSDADASANDESYRTPIGDALKDWGPVVLTAIVVPGGIVIALAMLVRRWYRHRSAAAAVRLATDRIVRA